VPSIAAGASAWGRGGASEEDRAWREQNERSPFCGAFSSSLSLTLSILTLSLLFLCSFFLLPAPTLHSPASTLFSTLLYRYVPPSTLGGFWQDRLPGTQFDK